SADRQNCLHAICVSLEAYLDSERRMVRQVGPGAPVESPGFVDVQIAYIDSVEAQQREACRKTPGRRAVGLDEYLLELAAGELGIGPLTPVIEVPCDDHRFVSGQLVEQATQQPQLLAPMSLAQPQVYADGVQVQLPGHIQNGVQQTAFFGAGNGYVEILVVQ